MSQPRPTDPIGSIGWAERTGGVLTARECLTLARPLVAGGAQHPCRPSRDGVPDAFGSPEFRRSGEPGASRLPSRKRCRSVCCRHATAGTRRLSLSPREQRRHRPDTRSVASSSNAKKAASCVAIDAVHGGDVRDARGFVGSVDVAVADAESAGGVNAVGCEQVADVRRPADVGAGAADRSGGVRRLTERSLRVSRSRAGMPASCRARRSAPASEPDSGGRCR